MRLSRACSGGAGKARQPPVEKFNKTNKHIMGMPSRPHPPCGLSQTGKVVEGKGREGREEKGRERKEGKGEEERRRKGKEKR